MYDILTIDYTGIINIFQDLFIQHRLTGKEKDYPTQAPAAMDFVGWLMVFCALPELQPDQINMAVFSGTPMYALQYKRTVDVSLFTRYQKHTAMYNFSPCMTRDGNFSRARI